MNVAKRLAAEDARLVLVPACQNVMHPTILLQHLNLQQARLPTVLMLGPARATHQPQLRRAGDGAQCRVRHVDVDGSGLARLWASHQSLAAIAQERADDWRPGEIENGEGNDGDDQINSNLHLAP